MATPTDERRSQFLTFRIAGEEYAMPLLTVREIIQYDRSARPTKVPQTPDWIHGVINLRDDEILPPPTFGTRVRTEFLRGVGSLPGGLALIMDVDAALSKDEVDAADCVPAGAP